MLPIIARWSIIEGKRTEALNALAELVEIVKTQEPFVPMYTVNVVTTFGSKLTLVVAGTPSQVPF